MNILDSYTHEVLSACINCKVDFIIVGGYAVNFHGYRRTTGDIDLWVRPDNNNKLNVVKALEILGIKPKALTQVMNFDFSKHVVFSDGEEPYKIDFLTYISGVNFEEAFQKKIIAEIDGLQLPFIDIKNLVISKFNTGRSQDAIDIETLQKIEQIKNDKKK